MAVVSKTYKFEAAHMLTYHKGKCANPHGHSYKVRVWVRGDIKLTSNDFHASNWGMVTDFDDLDQVMKPLIETFLDHKDLNMSLTGCLRTTAELIACWIFGYCFKAGLRVTKVRVQETDTSYAEVDIDDWIHTGQPGVRATSSRHGSSTFATVVGTRARPPIYLTEEHDDDAYKEPTPSDLGDIQQLPR